MKQIIFDLRGGCGVPDRTTEIDGLVNYFHLPSGQVISIQAVIEICSDVDADDYRDLTYDESVSLDLYLEVDKRWIEIDDRPF